MARPDSKRPRFRLQFSLLTLLLLATFLGPILGWYGPVAVAKVWSWFSKEEPSTVTNVLLPPVPMTRIIIKTEPMIGPVTGDIEKGMHVDALQHRARTDSRNRSRAPR